MRSYPERLDTPGAAGPAVFVTWRMEGSHPGVEPASLRNSSVRDIISVYNRPPDTVNGGPSYLSQPEIAGFVQAQLEVVAAQRLCFVDAFVIMPNHVHVLWTPRIPLPHLIRQVTGPTAVLANRFLGRTGKFIWDPDYLHRIAKSAAERDKIREYIAWSPVRAGLVSLPEQFRWSSAFRRIPTRPAAARSLSRAAGA